MDRAQGECHLRNRAANHACQMPDMMRVLMKHIDNASPVVLSGSVGSMQLAWQAKDLLSGPGRQQTQSQGMTQVNQ